MAHHTLPAGQGAASDNVAAIPEFFGESATPSGRRPGLTRLHQALVTSASPSSRHAELLQSAARLRAQVYALRAVGDRTLVREAGNDLGDVCATLVGIVIDDSRHLAELVEGLEDDSYDSSDSPDDLFPELTRSAWRLWALACALREFGDQVRAYVGKESDLARRIELLSFRGAADMVQSHGWVAGLVVEHSEKLVELIGRLPLQAFEWESCERERAAQ